MPNLESVAIRRAIDADVDDLFRVQRAALAAMHGVSPPAPDWRTLMGNPEHFVYLAEDETPFGFVCAGQPLDDVFEGKLTGEVIGLYLLPEYWGHGMGRKLLVRGLSVLKRRDFDSAFMWVREDAERALGVAASLHFERTAMSRTTNVGPEPVFEIGYQLDLGEYF